jgi:large subunit ribosomal protein L22
MMEIRATTRYLPISPQKLRLVCDQVRGMEPMSALAVLRNMPQKGAGFAYKTLKSAVANAENNFELDPSDLVIAKIYANEGPRRKWRRFGARGRFKPVIKRSSHLVVILSERELEPEPKPVAAENVAGEEEE